MDPVSLFTSAVGVLFLNSAVHSKPDVKVYIRGKSLPNPRHNGLALADLTETTVEVGDETAAPGTTARLWLPVTRIKCIWFSLLFYHTVCSSRIKQMMVPLYKMAGGPVGIRMPSWDFATLFPITSTYPHMYVWVRVCVYSMNYKRGTNCKTEQNVTQPNAKACIRLYWACS